MNSYMHKLSMWNFRVTCLIVNPHKQGKDNITPKFGTKIMQILNEISLG